MNDIKHPNFILGIISLLLLISGIALYSYRYAIADYIIGAGVVLGAIHWVWGIIDVLKHHNSHVHKENRNIIWVIMVIVLPPVGGILYYAMAKQPEF